MPFFAAQLDLQKIGRKSCKTTKNNLALPKPFDRKNMA
jgi:hypothetical protein